ncbi:hypothetical protein [Phenylobacterium aquaticum]|uniref:hypothetical protein n=1 Tax=Phenylobacterium aquaticum TaxID=1763816 RepID=UPI0026EA7A38|nr:hypothetical protein [Phenylobacterium aquaticum]
MKLNAADAASARIVEVYAKHTPLYAVYRTPMRVIVHFADDPSLASTQRATLAPLNPLRGQINSLIDGWGPARSKRFNRGVADALVVALEGDRVGAAAILDLVKQEIVDVRTSWARFSYLLVALLTSVVVVAAMIVGFNPMVAKIINLPHDGQGIWLGGGAGAVGAFFSIATAIRGRTVLTDFQWADNTIDAILRVVIGVISGMILYCMLKAQLVNLGVPVPGGDASDEQKWMFVTVLGFTAGFLERLVPDLLEKTKPTLASERTATQAMQNSSAGKLRPVAQDPAHEGEAHICDLGVSEDEATADEHLPPARGGVVKLRA